MSKSEADLVDMAKAANGRDFATEVLKAAADAKVGGMRDLKYIGDTYDQYVKQTGDKISLQDFKIRIHEEQKAGRLAIGAGNYAGRDAVLREQGRSLTRVGREDFAVIDTSKGPSGWSDEARAASAEARKADMKPEALTPAEMKTLERAMTSGRGEKVSKQHAAMIARASNEQVRALDDKAMAARRANAVSDADFNRLQDFRSQFREHAKKTSNADFNASIGRS